MSEGSKTRLHDHNFDNKIKIVEIRHRGKNIVAKICLLRLGIQFSGTHIAPGVDRWKAKKKRIRWEVLKLYDGGA